MAVDAHEIIKEYVFFPEVLPHAVKGRISRSLNGETFMWEISHHYKPTEGAAGAYYPSVISLSSFEEAQRKLFHYAECFTSIGVVRDEHY